MNIAGGQMFKNYLNTLKQKEVFPEWDVKRFALFSFVIFVVLIPITAYYNKWGDIDNYFGYASDVVNGMMPYRDFGFEYPPLSIVFMTIPRLFSSDQSVYSVLQALFSFVFFAIGIYYVYKIAERNKSHNGRMFFLLLLTLLLANIFVISRNDIYPTVFCIMSFYYFFDKRYTASWILISFAVMTKIYPIFIAPVLFMPFLLNKDYKNLLKGVIVCIATCVLISLPFIISDSSTAFSYLTYHAGRGLQIESVASSFILFFNIFSPGLVTVFFGHGSDNIAGPIPDMIAPFMDYLIVAALLLFFIWIFLRIRKMHGMYDSESVLRLSAVAGVAMLLIFISCCKVFSAQYVIWVMMLLIFTQFDCFDKRSRNMILILTVIYGIFSMINGDFTYNQLTQLDTGAVLVIFIRNILHLILLGAVIHLLIKETSIPRLESIGTV